MKFDRQEFVTSVVWTRRAWVTSNVSALVLAPPSLARGRGAIAKPKTPPAFPAQHASRSSITETSGESPVQRAVDTARSAGAQYADARLTRTTVHHYRFAIPSVPDDQEFVGIGVRVLVDGYWGFAALPNGDADAVVRLAQRAVAQARANATGASPRTVEMGQYPSVRGTWMTPMAIDPFVVSIEEKGDYLTYWMDWATHYGLYIDPLSSSLCFARQEQQLATSDGSLVTQTRVESGGLIVVKSGRGYGPTAGGPSLNIQGIAMTGKGWELFLDAKIPEQLAAMPEQMDALMALQKGARPFTVGRYTLVCDGATMAGMVGKTLGIATQIDRALGYEANAGGTSFVNDPLGMLGQFRVAANAVTVTANRSARAQLATVQWDDEGVAPAPFALVKDGVLVDMQTTREQAAWLAPYYAKRGEPVRSHGCAQGRDALAFPIQQRPNLALEPAPTAVRVDDLVADVKDGILLTDGETLGVDFQARNGLIVGTMRKITNGRVGSMLTGGAVLVNTLNFFTHVAAVGGPSTVGTFSHSAYDLSTPDILEMMAGHWKGEPPQDTSYSVSAAAATVAGQAVIDPTRKA